MQLSRFFTATKTCPIHNILVSHQTVSPTYCNKIVPMCTITIFAHSVVDLRVREVRVGFRVRLKLKF